MTPGQILQRIMRDLHEKFLKTLEFTTIRRQDRIFPNIIRRWVDSSALLTSRRRRDWQARP